ncbi:MAG: FAD-dependent oxidoreductase [Candidatus Bathyarchaeia archaeon]|nr:FAD-dependent oxidoreductase [Candidatus Bathyarchaeota archaeon]
MIVWNSRGVMLMGEKIVIGVFICHCGGNISDTVDVERVREAVSSLEDVKVAKTYIYLCSDPGQEMMKECIKEYNLNRVVVAACSPRMHLETFRQTIENAGLNRYLIEMANIREQCSWVHSDKEEATLKAIDLIRAAVARARFLEPLRPESIPLNRNVLVVGGGIAGLITALELADKGYKVYIVEKSPTIGGHMAQLSKTYPTLDCSQCILTPKMVSAAQHPNIEILTMTTVEAIEGFPGNYRVLVRKRPRFVNDNCKACGECEKVCPVKVPSEFDCGLVMRKAIYKPFPQAIPKTYLIDSEHCLHFTKGVCGLCQKFCKGNAIDFGQKEELIELDVGSIIVCTGYDQIDPSKLEEYSYGIHPDIITNLQFERLVAHGLRKPSNNGVPRKVAFVLCAGSRMRNSDRGVEHCCNIGCMVAIKQAMLLKMIVPDAEPCIFYTDLRAGDKGCEEFYNKALEQGIRFIRGRVSRIIPNGENLIVHAENTLLGTFMEEEFDLVVLSLGIISSLGTEELAKKLHLQIGSNSFLVERHYKLRPVDGLREGIFIAGCALGPKDIRESTIEAMAAASRASSFLGKGEITVPPEVAKIIHERCSECGICINICPVNAIQKTDKGMDVNPISCIGCGICVPRCPENAIDLKNCTESQLIAQIRAICAGGRAPRILAFLEKEIAYGCADLAGQNRVSYPSNLRIIAIPSTGRIGIRHILEAFASGADGVLLVEGHGAAFGEDALRQYISEVKRELTKYNIEFLRVMTASTTLPEYNRLQNIFETFTSRIMRMGPIPNEVRAKIEAALKREKLRERGHELQR